MVVQAIVIVVAFFITALGWWFCSRVMSPRTMLGRGIYLMLIGFMLFFGTIGFRVGESRGSSESDTANASQTVETPTDVE